MEKFYKISEEKLKALLYNNEVLNCLYAGGVDNWQWYMENKHDYLADFFEDECTDCDFEDIVEIELTEYEEIK